MADPDEGPVPGAARRGAPIPGPGAGGAAPNGVPDSEPAAGLLERA